MTSATTFPFTIEPSKLPCRPLAPERAVPRVNMEESGVPAASAQPRSTPSDRVGDAPMAGESPCNFTVEKIDLRDPDGNCRPEIWTCESAEDAAMRFDSEVECGVEEVAEMLAAPGSAFRIADVEAGVEMIASQRPAQINYLVIERSPSDHRHVWIKFRTSSYEKARAQRHGGSIIREDFFLAEVEQVRREPGAIQFRIVDDSQGLAKDIAAQSVSEESA